MSKWIDFISQNIKVVFYVESREWKKVHANRNVSKFYHSRSVPSAIEGLKPVLDWLLTFR